MAQTCPKCARENEDGAVICAGCDFILDTSFLGDDILNSAEGAAVDVLGDAVLGDSVPGDSVPGDSVPGDSVPGDAVPADVAFDEQPDTMGGDTLGTGALILGKVNADTGDAAEWASFESEQTGDFLCAPTSHGMRRLEPSTVYIDAETRALLEQDAVLRVKEGVDIGALTLSPFEAHVLAFIDGERPVARIQSKSGLSEEDLRICLTLIADKGALERVGTAKSASGGGDDDFKEKTVATLELPPEAADDAEMPDFLGGPTQATDSIPVEAAFAEPAAQPNPFEGEPVVEQNPVTLPPDMLTPLPAAGASAPAVPSLPGQSGVPSLPGQKPKAAAAPAPAKRPAKEPSRKQRKAPVIVEKQAPSSGAGPAVQEVKRSDPTYLKALNLYETALRDIGQGRLPRAKGLAMMAHDLVPDDPKFAELVNEWSRAREIAEMSDQAPEHVQAFHKAKAAEAEGDFDEAITQLEKAAKLKPDHAGIQNQLGVLLATKRKDYTRAMGFLFKAVELDKKNTAYRNNLGKVLAMSGNSGQIASLSDGSDDGPPGKKVEEKKGGMLGRFLKR